jgi:1-phosphofructokinase
MMTTPDPMPSRSHVDSSDRPRHRRRRAGVPGRPPSGPSLLVFAPSPLLTITVEASGTPHEEIHLHAGGQGFWVARMAALLGADARLCCALGGESGAVLRALIAKESVELQAIECAAPNGVYIHTRRDGVRRQVARTVCQGLSRHEADELYGVALSAALDSDIVMLTGVDPPDVLESDVYRRLAGDLRSNDVQVIADLSGAPLASALAGGIDVLKISDDELRRNRFAPGGEVAELLAGLDVLHASGAHTVLLSRAEQPALVHDDASDRYLQLTAPRVEALEPHGTGDSMFAALGASLALGHGLEDALRLAMAAGCLNATRHGLGTGTREQIEQLSRHIEVRVLDRSPAARQAEEQGAAPSRAGPHVGENVPAP